MIVVMKSNVDSCDLEKVKDKVMGSGLEVQEVKGVDYHYFGLIGNLESLDTEELKIEPSVEKIISVPQPFKKASRQFHPEDSLVPVNDQIIGGHKLAIIAGPCSVESHEQIMEVAQEVKKAGASFLRGGAFKPRSSPYSFQGLEEEGLELLLEAKNLTGLPLVVELMGTEKLDLFLEHVDVIQIGARNMQNFSLLKAVGQSRKPILLKRGMAATIDEFLMAAEYILAGGNENVILCERGIRSFDSFTRNILDLSAIPAIKRLSHLPIIVDPSHATGHWWMVEPLAKAAIAVGADGLMIEVHNAPTQALCDGPQSLKPQKFLDLMTNLKNVAQIVQRGI